MMTPIFLNPPTSNASSFPFMELRENQCDRHSSQHNNLSSSSSLSSTLFTKSPPPDDQFARRNPSSDDPSNHNGHNKVYDEYTTHGESSDHNSHHQVDSASGHLYYNKVSSAKQQDGVGENVRNGNGSSMKWMCSKVRLMRKMTQSDEKAPSWRIELKTHHDHYQQPENSETVVVENNNGGDIIRVCSNCNTTKTPLWRSGPQGPKSLCNACGIRQRKARRAMEAAAAGGSTVVTGGGEGSSSSTSVKSTLKLVTKKKKSRSSHYNLAEHNKKSAHHHKQRFDQVKESFVDENNEKNHWFEEFAKNLLMKNSSFQRMFTRDEEEGAVLLMALSYGHGLVQS